MRRRLSEKHQIKIPENRQRKPRATETKRTPNQSDILSSRLSEIQIEYFRNKETYMDSPLKYQTPSPKCQFKGAKYQLKEKILSQEISVQKHIVYSQKVSSYSSQQNQSQVSIINKKYNYSSSKSNSLQKDCPNIHSKNVHNLKYKFQSQKNHKKWDSSYTSGEQVVPKFSKKFNSPQEQDIQQESDCSILQLQVFDIQFQKQMLIDRKIADTKNELLQYQHKLQDLRREQYEILHEMQEDEKMMHLQLDLIDQRQNRFIQRIDRILGNK